MNPIDWLKQVSEEFNTWLSEAEADILQANYNVKYATVGSSEECYHSDYDGYYHETGDHLSFRVHGEIPATPEQVAKRKAVVDKQREKARLTRLKQAEKDKKAEERRLARLVKQNAAEIRKLLEELDSAD
jgi:hypothetical protein